MWSLPLSDSPKPLSILTVGFCELSHVTAIVHASNQLSLFHAIGNGIQALPPLPVVENLLVSGNSLTAIHLLTVNIDSPFTFHFPCNAINSILHIAALF
jgi:Leucine-rich repeat (LRR) protein